MTALVNTISGYASQAGNFLPGEWTSTGQPGNSGTGATPPPATGKEFSIFDAVTQGLNLASVGLSLFAGQQAAEGELSQSRQQARALELSAEDDLLDAQQEEIKGKQAANDILENLRQTIATQQLAAAVNGIDGSFGTPASAADSARKIAGLQLGVTREDARVRSIARRRQAFARREEALNVRSVGEQNASAARLTSLAKAGGTIAEAVMRRSERG